MEKGTSKNVVKKTTVKKKTVANTSERLKKAAVLKALEKKFGIVTDACKAVKLGRTTFYKWYNTDENFKNEVDSITELCLDIAESNLLKLIQGFEAPEDKVFIHNGKPVIVKSKKVYIPDNTSIIFYLKTKGKKRGYIERQEITGKDGSAIETNNTSTVVILPSNGREKGD